MHVVAAPDKFKGTATAREIAEAIEEGASPTASVTLVPMADGGDGTLDALGGVTRVSTVTGPLGTPVEASWRLESGRAVIEMARSSGLVLAGGAEGNRPLDASTRGVGELIIEAVDAGATEIIVGVGGSATTDGGLGALEAIGSRARLRGVAITVACDVRTRFTDAARVFAPQKGASEAQVALLTNRLESLAERYLDETGVDVREMDRAGAAGGLAGGLATVGAVLVDGFDVVADVVDLAAAIEAADLVVTGEGFLDGESFEGKVVGGVLDLSRSAGVPVLAIVGQVFDDAASGLDDEVFDVVSLREVFGLERAMADPCACVREVVEDVLSRR